MSSSIDSRLRRQCDCRICLYGIKAARSARRAGPGPASPLRYRRAGPAMRSRLADSYLVAALVTTCVGLLLTIAGVSCAGVAFFQTWREHERRPLFPALAVALIRGRAAARRLAWWRTPKHTTAQLSAVLPGLSGSMQGHLTVYGPDIPPDAPVEEAVRLLLRRVERIEETARDDRQRSTTSVAELRTELASRAGALRETVRETDNDLRELTKKVAVGTVKLQLWGLILVGTGTVLMTIPTIITMIANLS